MEQIRNIISSNIISSIVITVSIVYMIKERRRVPKGQTIQDQLSWKEKILIWILCLMNPIITGAILYYGLKNKLPIKAKQINKISILFFFVMVLLMTIIIYFRISSKL